MTTKRKSKPKTVKAEELSSSKMTTGSEKKHTKVIDDGMLKSWVGIGWVAEKEATESDKLRYPTVVYD